jgi:hypothetical protein
VVGRQRDDDGRRGGGSAAIPGARVVAAWPRGRRGLPGTSAAMVAPSIVTAAAAHDVRRRVTQRGGTNFPASRPSPSRHHMTVRLRPEIVQIRRHDGFVGWALHSRSFPCPMSLCRSFLSSRLRLASRPSSLAAMKSLASLGPCSSHDERLRLRRCGTTFTVR